jgi:cbb3-type cytochrome oxidase maturation protein
MSVIFILIACSLTLAGGFLLAFLWASKSGQFEDDYTPSIRMLFDDGVLETPNSENNHGTKNKSAAKTKKST